MGHDVLAVSGRSVCPLASARAHFSLNIFTKNHRSSWSITKFHARQSLKKCLALVDKHRDGHLTKADAIAEIASTLYGSANFSDHDKQAGLSTYCAILEQEDTANRRQRDRMDVTPEPFHDHDEQAPLEADTDRDGEQLLTCGK
jgi:hypothetical protein